MGDPFLLVHTTTYLIQTLNRKFQLNRPSSFGDMPKYILRMREWFTHFWFVHTTNYLVQTLCSKFQLNRPSSFRDTPKYLLRMRSVAHMILTVAHYSLLTTDPSQQV